MLPQLKFLQKNETAAKYTTLPGRLSTFSQVLEDSSNVDTEDDDAEIAGGDSVVDTSVVCKVKALAAQGWYCVGEAVAHFSRGIVVPLPLALSCTHPERLLHDLTSPIEPEEGNLQILKAWYGPSTSRWDMGTDVTDAIKALVKPDGLYITGGSKNISLGVSDAADSILLVRCKYGNTGTVREYEWDRLDEVFLPAGMDRYSTPDIPWWKDPAVLDNAQGIMKITTFDMAPEDIVSAAALGEGANGANALILGGRNGKFELVGIPPDGAETLPLTQWQASKGGFADNGPARTALSGFLQASDGQVSLRHAAVLHRRHGADSEAAGSMECKEDALVEENADNPTALEEKNTEPTAEEMSPRPATPAATVEGSNATAAAEAEADPDEALIQDLENWVFSQKEELEIAEKDYWSDWVTAGLQVGLQRILVFRALISFCLLQVGFSSSHVTFRVCRVPEPNHPLVFLQTFLGVPMPIPSMYPVSIIRPCIPEV